MRSAFRRSPLRRSPSCRAQRSPMRSRGRRVTTWSHPVSRRARACAGGRLCGWERPGPPRWPGQAGRRPRRRPIAEGCGTRASACVCSPYHTSYHESSRPPRSPESRLIRPVQRELLRTCCLTQLPKHDRLSKHQIQTSIYTLRGRGSSNGGCGSFVGYCPVAQQASPPAGETL